MANKAQFAEECLKLHNTLRSLHCSPDLVLDIKLSAFAQDWADALAKKDNLEPRPENCYGENLYVGSCGPGQWCAPQVAVHSWYGENRQYDFAAADSVGEERLEACKNFTQLVWKSSCKLGVGVAVTAEGKTYVVCNYDERGNVAGQYAENVTVAALQEIDPVALIASKEEGPQIRKLQIAPEEIQWELISEEDARLWSSWMLKVADKSLNEWQSWLDSHIDLATRMNNSLIRARNPAELEEADDPLKRIETSEICAADNETKNLESDNNAINEVQKSEEEQRSAVDTKSATSIGIVPTATTTCRKRRAATNRCCGGLPEEAEGKSEKKDNLVNGKTEKTPKIIPLPRDEFEMLKIVDDFKRRAKLYKLLYNHWITTANRVIEEIVEKSAGQQQQQQQAVPQEEIPYFFYLRDEVENDDSGVGIDSCPDSDDDEDGKCCIGQERITWRNTHLFFNLMDE